MAKRHNLSEALKQAAGKPSEAAPLSPVEPESTPPAPQTAAPVTDTPLPPTRSAPLIETAPAAEPPAVSPTAEAAQVDKTADTAAGAAAAPADTSAAARSVAPSRVGKKVVAGYFDPAVAKQLKQMTVDQDTTIQALLVEALNLLFTKHGKPPIAE